MVPIFTHLLSLPKYSHWHCFCHWHSIVNTKVYGKSHRKKMPNLFKIKCFRWCRCEWVSGFVFSFIVIFFLSVFVSFFCVCWESICVHTASVSCWRKSTLSVSQHTLPLKSKEAHLQWKPVNGDHRIGE